MIIPRDGSTVEPAAPVFIVKFQRGASGVQRSTFQAALEAADDRAERGAPATVYVVGAPNVKLATVHVDGGIDFTPEARQYR